MPNNSCGNHIIPPLLRNRKRMLTCVSPERIVNTRKRSRLSELSRKCPNHKPKLKEKGKEPAVCDRIRKAAYSKSPTNGNFYNLRVNSANLFETSSTSSMLSRLRSFNGMSIPNNHSCNGIGTKYVENSSSTISSSDLENNSFSEEIYLKAQNSPHVELVPIFSPRRFVSVNKDQAAKLKRLNARRIEFDTEEVIDNHEINNSVVYEESILNQSLVGDPKEKLLELCEQTEVRSFSSYFDSQSLESIVKIGEGVYGEVFQTHKGSVIKIFPIDGDLPVNGEKQMESYRVYPEVFISRQLTQLGFKYRQNRSVNFIQLRKASVISGKWPIELITAWKVYEVEHGSDNQCLDFLPSSQEWMVLEFEFAGKPLGSIKFNSYREARSVIEQIAISLAAAESALQFEHRDLHWLNVLVKPTRQEKLRYRVGGVSYAVQTEGIHVSIIDFTVSRIYHEGNIVYVDMSKSPEIFECEGDYQFDIYRMMRDMNGNNWRTFRPITNLYWLHYLMDKLLNETSYPRHDPDSHAIESELAALHDSVLSGAYKSATQLVSSSFYFDTCRID